MTPTVALTVLGLRAGCSEVAAKAAFRRLAKLHHPDVGGDAEKFKKVSEAYAVLQHYGIPHPTYDPVGSVNFNEYGDVVEEPPITYTKAERVYQKPESGYSQFGYTDEQGVFHKFGSATERMAHYQDKMQRELDDLKRRQEDQLRYGFR